MSAGLGSGFLRVNRHPARSSMKRVLKQFAKSNEVHDTEIET